MPRRSRENESNEEAPTRTPSDAIETTHNVRRKRRRVAGSTEPVAPSNDHSVTAHSTATLSISILSEPTSSPASVRKAILDIKTISNVSPSDRSLVINSGCIPHLLHHLGVGVDDNDQHILQVVDVLCKDNSDIRRQFRTLAFIKKAVALAIPALGDRASSSSTARSARSILKELSSGDSSNSEYDNEVLQEQQQRLNSLKEEFFMTQTMPYNMQQPLVGGECENCCVCLEKLNYDAASSSVTPASTIACCLPCNHSFHKSCITNWLPKHASCPVCRHKLQEAPRTPPVLSQAVDPPFPLALLLSLGAFGGAGMSFGFPPNILPAGMNGGMNVVFISVRSGSGPRRDGMS